MLKEQVPVRSYGWKHPKTSTPYAKKHVDFEYEIITSKIKQVIKENLEERKGIMFGQHNLDGVKSAKGAKLYWFGL